MMVRHQTHGRWQARVLGPALASLLLALTASTPACAAVITYEIQPIVKFGDQVADLDIKKTDNAFAIGGLNDNGQIVFSTQPTEAPSGLALIQYTDGIFTPILVAGRQGPIGNWPRDIRFHQPSHMNQLGNVVFSAFHPEGGDVADLGTFLWDYRAQTVTPVARKGMPAAHNLTLESGGYDSPVINNRNEIAFPAQLKNAAGEAWTGIFFRGQDGKLVPVALPEQEMPDGRKAVYAVFPSVSDAGVVAFLAQREGDAPGQASAYVWENGAISVVALVGTEVSGGGRIASVEFVGVNSKNRNVLLAVRLNNPANGPTALYLLADGKLIPVAVPGRQEMPGGGTLKGIPFTPFAIHAISPANNVGQHAFIAMLADGGTAAYLMDVDGKLSLILKSGTATELGTIRRVGRGTGRSLGVALNNKGQVVLPVQLESGGDAILLLTPVSP